MQTDRQRARITGWLYLVTVVTSIPALALKESFFAGGSANAAAAATVLELILAVACVGTAIVIFPVIQRVSSGSAFGFVAARTVEAAIISVGVLAVMASVTLRSEGSETSATGMQALHDWAFLIGPGVIPAINAALLGTALLRGKLVPRALPLVGVIGAPLLLCSALMTLFGVFDQVSTLAGVLALPIAVWEIGLGLWLIVRGINQSPSWERNPLLESSETAPLT